MDHRRRIRQRFEQGATLADVEAEISDLTAELGDEACAALWLYAWQVAGRNGGGDPYADGSSTVPAPGEAEVLEFGARRTYELPGGAYAPTAARLALDATAASADSAMLFTLRLLVSELVTNSVLHGGAGEQETIELVVALAGARARVEVCDPGHGFELSAAAGGAEAVNGRGLQLVDALADRWGVSNNGGTRVWFELDRRPPGEGQATA